jgi:hypothetical protein
MSKSGMRQMMRRNPMGMLSINGKIVPSYGEPEGGASGVGKMLTGLLPLAMVGVVGYFALTGFGELQEASAKSNPRSRKKAHKKNPRR